MKKYLFTFIIVFFIVNSILFPSIALNATKNGLSIWFTQILPSLLPFSILSTILLNSKWISSLTTRGNIISISITMICGIIFGFPIGAKLSSDFYKQNLLSQKQAQILCVCMNNFSPMYIMGYVFPLLFGTTSSNCFFLFLLYGIPVLTACTLLFIRKEKENVQKKSASRFQLDMQIIDAGIISGFETLIKICGYIVLFSLITAYISIFVTKLELPQLFILGNLEITNGIHLLSENISQPFIKTVLAIQFLTFGGLSGLAQSASFLSSSGLSMVKYTVGKLMLSGSITIIAAVYLLIF